MAGQNLPKGASYSPDLSGWYSGWSNFGGNLSEFITNPSATAKKREQRPARPASPGQYYGPGGNPDASGQGQAQLRTTPFGIPGINPRTNLPYSESPGKPGVEPPDAPKPSATPEGRTNTKTETNPNGVTQTMTNTGAINMPGLADVDMTGIANFAGPSFPTQQDTNKINDSFIATKTKFLTEPKNKDGSAFEVPGATGESTNMAITGNTFRPQTYASGAAGDIGGLDGFKPGGKFSGAPTATEGQRAYRPSDPSGEGIGGFGDEDMAITGPDPASYAVSNEETARRRAFLDADDSMSGMQAVAAGLGMGNQGTRNFANVDGKPVEISSSDRRAVLNAASGEAQALKDKWVKSISASKADEPQLASSAQNPTEDSGSATFVTDKKTDLSSQALGVDYSNNNADDNIAIGGLGGKNKLNAGAFNNNASGFQNTKATQFYLPK